MDKSKDLIPVSIYQTKDSCILVDRPHFNSSVYEIDKNPFRMLLLDVSIGFIEDCNKATKDELFNLLSNELDSNTNTIYLD